MATFANLLLLLVVLFRSGKEAGKNQIIFLILKRTEKTQNFVWFGERGNLKCVHDSRSATQAAVQAAAQAAVQAPVQAACQAAVKAQRMLLILWTCNMPGSS